MARSDYFSPTQKQEIYFSDIPMNLDKNPFSNNLAVITNEEAVKQSIKCLLLTSLGERFYDSTIGSDVKRNLFEQNDSIAINTINFAIKNTIDHNEPRVNLLGVKSVPASDGSQITVTVVFALINDPTPITLNMILKRVR